LTWGTFEEAVRRAEENGLGIGFVFSSGDPFVGVDLDRCRDPETGEIVFEEWQRDQRTYSSNEYSEPEEAIRITQGDDDSNFLDADCPKEDEAFEEDEEGEAFEEEYDSVSRGLEAMFEEHPETRHLGTEELAHFLADTGLVSPKPDTLTVEIAREGL
jgi:hypothetical protein